MARIRSGKASAQSLLLVFAHPDDESFGVGGTAALYAAAGTPVHLACATKGERGTKDTALTGQKLGAIREGELRRACAVLGVRNISFLGYMDGDVDKVAFPEMVESIAAVMRRVRPDAVVTFGPDGVTRHPDHVAVGRAATAAFHRVRRREGYRYPRRLYYVALPESRRRAVRSGAALMYTPAAQITAAVG
ncbi:MAG: PIG-L family deacetylase, partial [Chloroflexota bacterium]